jgi:hypothetical protein
MRRWSHLRDRQWRLRSPLSSIAVAAATFLVVTAAVCGDGGPPTDGPLRMQGADEKSVAYLRADFGRRVVYGYNIVTNRGKTDATLVSARLVGTVSRRNAYVETVRMKPLPGNTGDTVGADVWPTTVLAPHSDRQLTSHVMHAGEAVELLFIVRVRQRGRWEWPRTELTYRSGGRLWRSVAASGFLVCVPATITCDPRKVT